MPKRSTAPRRRKTTKERIEDEQLKKAQRHNRFIRQLEVTEPDTYRRAMLEEMGLDHLAGNGSRGANHWLQDIAAGLSMTLPALMQMRGIAASNEAGTLPPPVAPVSLPPAHVTPAPPPVAQTAPDPMQTTEGEPLNIQQQLQRRLITTAIVSGLTGKAPDEAAIWILSQNHSAAGNVVNLIQTTPEDQWFTQLDQLAAAEPRYSGVVAWLRERPEWFIETARALKTRAAVA